MRTHKRPAIICLLTAILIAWLCIHFDTTPFIGLPHIQGFNGFPPGTIPGPEEFSNATFILRRFSF